MKGGHGSEFVRKTIIGPDRAFASGAMDCVYESSFYVRYLLLLQQSTRVAIMSNGIDKQ